MHRSFPAPARAITNAVHALDSWLDLVVYHGELFDALKLAAPALVGHSFGGLVAAEIAAAAPKSVSRLVADRSGRPVARRSAGQELDAAQQ